MDKVFIITSGEYSDYGIDRVCSTREKAEAALRFYEDATIEEWELDKTLPLDPTWRVYIYPDHEVEDMAEMINPESAEKERIRHHPQNELRGSAGYEWYYVTVMTPTKAQALKIARDRVGIERAREAGIG